MPNLEDVGVRLRVEDDATAPLQRVRESASQATMSLRDMASADPVLIGTSAQLDKLAISAERASASLDQLSLRGSSALASTVASTDNLSRSTGNLDRTLSSASSTALGFFGNLVKYGGAAFAGLTAAAGYFGVTTAASFDQTRVAFGTLLGSVEQGNALFKQLQAYNLQTPFGLPDLTRAEQTLLQYGLGNQSVPVLKTLANVAAVGTDPTNDLTRSALALGQISNSGVIRGQDINQLTQAGFPVIKLLQQITGQTGAQLQEQIQGGGIQLPASGLIQAIAGGGGSVLSPYASAAQAQSLTLRGQASNFKDTLRSDLADASTPLGAQLLQTLPQLTTAMHELLTVAGPPVFAFLGDLLHAFTGLIPVLQPILTGLSSGLHEFLSSMGPGAKDLIPVGEQLGSAFHELFTDLAGHGPELSHLMVDLVLILPDMVQILDDLVPLVDLFVRGVDGILSFGPSRDMAAGLLTVLLGYGALAKTAKTIDLLTGSILGLSTATRGLAIAEAEEAAAGSAGRGGRLGGKGLLGIAGAVGVGAALTHNTSGDSRMGLLGNWGEGALGGAATGFSVGGPMGAAWGGALGLLGSTGKSFYDALTDDGSHGAPHSQIWDPSKPGYGGYQEPGAASVTDNRKLADQLIIQGDRDEVLRTLQEYEAERDRRK